MVTTAHETSRKHCFFQGRVQGVGFRYTTRNIAIGYDVTGFVRNMDDGRVELVAEGPEQEVSAFISAIADRMNRYVAGITAQDEPASGEYPHFSIAR